MRTTPTLAVALLGALATSTLADGLFAERVQATFTTSRKGEPRDRVRLRGTITDRASLLDFDPETSGMQLRVGDFVAVSANPEAGGGAFRMKKGAWRLRSRLGSARVRLKLDTRSGAVRLDVKKANAARLEDGGPQYALVRLELGSRVMEDAVVFDEQRRGGSVRWRSLARGVPIEPPPDRPDGTPLPGGTLPYTILSSGEQSTVLMPEVAVARSQAQWDAMYARAAFTGPHQQPGVDFTQEMVIGVFLGLVSQRQIQLPEIVNVSDDGAQTHVSWRSHYRCGPFVCSSGTCPDFAPFVFVRVRRVGSEVIGSRAPAVFDDCP